MFNGKSTLLEQITNIIQKKPFSAKSDSSSVSSVEQEQCFDKSDIRSYSSFFGHNMDLKELSQRIEILEEQNNHLLYILHFLFDNFNDLVKNTLTKENKEKEFKISKTNICTNNDESVRKNSQSLTKRETEICRLLVNGLCAKEIAKILFISETTVITHKKNLKEKFMAKNTVELISKIYKNSVNMDINTNK